MSKVLSLFKSKRVPNLKIV